MKTSIVFVETWKYQKKTHILNGNVENCKKEFAGDVIAGQGAREVAAA